MVYVLFFTLTGAALDVDSAFHAILLSSLLFAVRFAAIFVGTNAGGRIAGLPQRHNRRAWMAYGTQAGVALVCWASLSLVVL